MAELSSACRAFFADYLKSLSPEQKNKMTSRHLGADYFCADEENANLCADLVRRGEKRATCGLAHWYDCGEERMPQVGDLLIVLNWRQKPIALVELYAVERLPFHEVGADFAAEEGEGDKSYSWWRDVHWDFFANELKELGRDMRETEEVVTERFRLLWPL